MKEKMNFKTSINWNKIRLFLKTGILGATLILVGDFLMGWGVKDMSLTGIEREASLYLKVSDGRMFWSSLLGMIGVPIAFLGHIGIYKLLKPYSKKYSRLYLIGILGFLAFGGAGVHVSSIESAFFYKYMTEISPNTALATSVKFVSYFSLPLYIALISFWIILVYSHIKAVVTGLSPFPRWCWIFSMLVGTMFISLLAIFGNYPFINAIMVGAFSVGNIWTLSGHLLMLNKAKENIKDYIL